MKYLVIILIVLATGCANKQKPSTPSYAPDGQSAYRKQPLYPVQAQAQRIEGDVEASYTVNEKGCAENVRILSAQPADIFDRETLSAMNNWCGMKPTSIPQKITITFRLNGGSQVGVPAEQSL